MSCIHLLIAATPPDLEAEGIAAAVARCSNISLVQARVVALGEVDACLEGMAHLSPCALILVGRMGATREAAGRWLAARPDLVVLRVDSVDHLVTFAQVASRDRSLDMDSLLAALRALVTHARCANAAAPAVAVPELALLPVALDWIHILLRSRVGEPAGDAGDLPGLTLTAASMAAELDARPGHTAPALPPAVAAAGAALERALHAADPATDRLAAVARGCGLTELEFRLLVLALAPEVDLRYQRCIGILLDDLGRRTGTLALYAGLLGEMSEVRGRLAHSGALVRWRLLDSRGGALPAADEPLRLDPPLLAWLFGDPGALDADPCLRRVLRAAPWAGASLLDGAAEQAFGASLAGRLVTAPDETDPARFVLLDGAGSAWCALLELGATRLELQPLRADVSALAGLDPSDLEDTCVRLARAARLPARPLLLDACSVDESPAADDLLRRCFGALAGSGVRCAVLCTDAARAIRLIGAAPFAVTGANALPASMRANSLAAAARLLGADGAQLDTIARQYPLQVDGFEHAMRLAAARQAPAASGPERLEGLLRACQHVAAEGVSHMAESIEPAFGLKDVILPPDRMRQLEEIAGSVELAPQVLDGWKFGAQLPYGRSVTAMFHGPSGTGKTMAALGLAKRLNTRVLRIDLSRVVSKYIGDTEKNIDRIFLDAQRSGAAILIDEAEALLGKRSEVKDAHDRYANIEVAYLLQRMETYEGLAILTTNLRQNLDPAFLRRVRFMIEFPRPDAGAREQIWRRCLPDGSHRLDDTAFSLLARKVDLTGGHIRQITLRAAFLAAAEGTVIGLPHVVHATGAELAKLGMAAIGLELPEQRQAA